MPARPEILNELKPLGSMLLHEATGANPYRVPAGYFEHFPEQVWQNLQNNKGSELREELLAVAPLLNEISKTGPYQVPVSYFDQRDTKKMIPPPARSRIISFAALYPIAVAAAVTGIILLGLFSHLKPDSTANIVLNIPASIPDAELGHFLESDDLTASLSIDLSVASAEWSAENGQKLFEGIPMQELESYAQQFTTYHSN